MRELILLRHAHAVPASPGQADLDRPLSPEGLAEAEAAGRWLREQGLAPDRVLCSPSRRTRASFARVSRKGTVASMSSVEGRTGTTTASARSRKGISSCAIAPAAPSTMTMSVSSGSSRCQPRLALLPSIGSTALSRPARFSAQRVEERCGSASTSTVRWPARAACAARWVAMVVLPTPPLELATRIVFTRTSVAGHVSEAYHCFGAQPRPDRYSNACASPGANPP